MSRGLLISATVFAGGEIRSASLPDAYESAQYRDNASTTTRNILYRYSESNPGRQRHSIHSESDIDWGICEQDAGGTTFPYSLRFTELKLPQDTYLKVNIYGEGVDSPATSTEHIPSYDRTFDVSWLGGRSEKVLFSIEAIGKVEPQIEYSIIFVRNTGFD